jgi:hypothetical protein
MTLAKGLFLALPTYGGSRFNLMPIIKGLTGQQSFGCVVPYESDVSLLAMSFNRLWCEALKMRQKGLISHFLLMHADIVPVAMKADSKANWLDDLYLEMVAAKAEVLSVISPIKDDRGLTSTGLDTGDLWSPRRLTMKEVEAQDVDTFTHPDLILNTGLLLIDLKNDWVKKICFTIKDTIRWTAPSEEYPEGMPYPAVQPEDWDFSRQARALGVQLWATKRIKIAHKGHFNYPNFGKWGRYDQDLGDGALPPTVIEK